VAGEERGEVTTAGPEMLGAPPAAEFVFFEYPLLTTYFSDFTQKPIESRNTGCILADTRPV
jgi:hypothetical protein